MAYLLMFLFVFSGCSCIPQIEPIHPPQEVLETALDEADLSELVQGASRIPEEWWLIFDDEQLTELIEKALSQNPTLQSVEMKISSAASLATRAKSALFPYIYWGADVSRQKLSETGVIPFASGPAGSDTPIIDVPATPGGASPIPAYFTLYETELNLKYEFDFWRKNRNTFRAALGRVQANIAEFHFASLELAVAVAKKYYQLQTDEARKKNAEALVRNKEAYFTLIQERLNSNIETNLALQTAELTSIDAGEFALQIEADRVVHQYQLMAYLGGEFNEWITPDPILDKPLPVIPLPSHVPLNLIAKRADITAQIWLIESADRQIDVARAGFYPDFNLAAFFGFQTIHFQELFKWPSTFFNVDPAVSLPIFDGGKLMANLEASQINYNLAILDYNQLVIDAAEEVLQALALLKNRWELVKETEKQVNRRASLNELTRLRSQHHLSSELDVLISEAAYLEAKDQEIRARGAVLNTMLELIKALGGGYECDCT